MTQVLLLITCCSSCLSSGRDRLLGRRAQHGEHGDRLVLCFGLSNPVSHLKWAGQHLEDPADTELP